MPSAASGTSSGASVTSVPTICRAASSGSRVRADQQVGDADRGHGRCAGVAAGRHRRRAVDRAVRGAQCRQVGRQWEQPDRAPGRQPGQCRGRHTARPQQGVGAARFQRLHGVPQRLVCGSRGDPGRGEQALPEHCGPRALGAQRDWPAGEVGDRIGWILGAHHQLHVVLVDAAERAQRQDPLERGNAGHRALRGVQEGEPERRLPARRRGGCSRAAGGTRRPWPWCRTRGARPPAGRRTRCRTRPAHPPSSRAGARSRRRTRSPQHRRAGWAATG